MIEVDPPRRLVYTWKPSWEQGPATTVSYRLEATPTGTRVTVRHTGFTTPQACAGHAEGWERVFGWLSGHLAAKGDVFFLARLIPPRPTFPGDMTAEEAEIMKAHAAYCRGRLAEGTALVFGPVADPSGVWGAGVLKVKDEAAARAITAADPAVLSGKGFSYELLPMLSAMY